MKLRDDYLCTQCQMFHPLELDKFLKNQIKALIRDYPDSSHHERLREQIALWWRVNIAQKKGNSEGLRLMKEHVDSTHAALLEEERNASSAKRKEILELKRCDIFIDDIICEAIGSNKRICFDQLVKAAGFDANFPTKKFKTEEARQRSMRLNIYYQYVKIHTVDASSQWFEITDGVVLSKLNPIWFSGHRVYEIPVKLGRSDTDNTIMPGQYYCTVQVNSKDETVVRFDPCRCVRPRYGFGHIPQFHSIVATMSTVLCNQVQECDEVYSVLRLNYYDGYKKPRFFLRVPGTSTKVLPNTIADLVPVYSGKSYGEYGMSYGLYIDAALMNKTASLKINDDLDLNFLPNIEQD